MKTNSRITHRRKPLVLVHDPRDEMFPGVLHPDAALFSDYLDVREANREHAALRRLLARCGLEVVTIRQVLLEGTLTVTGEVVPGPELEALKEFASRFLEYDSDESIDAAEQESYKQEVLRKAHPVDLLRIILNRPRITIRRTGDNTGFAADYTIRPMMNLLFMRDQMISTRRGVVIGRLNSPQRLGEGLVADFCVRKLGLVPLLRISGQDDFLEGGDFLTWGDTAYINSGMRTTDSAVKMLFEADAYGTDTVVVVKDRLFWQPQMHLDTWFNIADERLVVMSVNRLYADVGSAAFPTADIYRRNGAGEYRLEWPDIPFKEYLAKEGYEIIPVSMEDSANFGVNFLSVGPREIIAVRGQSAEYKKNMRAQGIIPHWVDLTHCTKGYGAVHCMTQVIQGSTETQDHNI